MWVTMLAWSVAACGALGILIDLVLAEDVKAALRLFNYYTIQTNVMVAAIAAFAAWHGSQSPSWLGQVGQAATIWITVTSLGYHFLLSRLYNPEGWQAVANHLLHYITPLGMIIYSQLVWGEQIARPTLWLSYPLVYGVANLARGSLTGYYPYWFLRPSGTYPDGNGSYARVLVFLLVILAVYYLIGLLLTGWRGLVVM